MDQDIDLGKEDLKKFIDNQLDQLSDILFEDGSENIEDEENENEYSIETEIKTDHLSLIKHENDAQLEITTFKDDNDVSTGKKRKQFEKAKGDGLKIYKLELNGLVVLLESWHYQANGLKSHQKRILEYCLTMLHQFNVKYVRLYLNLRHIC